jgi:hypothetical protein
MIRLQKQHHKYYTKMREFSTLNSDVPVGGHRVFPLMNDEYRGAWECKMCIHKRTCRVFDMLDTANHKVRIY